MSYPPRVDYQAVRADFQSGMTKQAVAQKYGIAWLTVHRIVTGDNWKRKPELNLADPENYPYGFVSRGMLN